MILFFSLLGFSQVPEKETSSEEVQMSQAYYQVAKRLLNKAAYENAIEAYLVSLKHDPPVIAYKEIAQAYQFLGKYEEAEQAYLEAVRRYDSAGSSSTYPKLNLAITLAERGCHQEALEGMSAVLHKVEKLDLGIVSAVRAIRLYPLASLNLWADVSADVERVYKPLLDGAFTDFDVARFTQKAAQCCLDNGRKAEAIKLFELALNQWESLERKEEIEEVRALLGRTSTGDE